MYKYSGRLCSQWVRPHCLVFFTPGVMWINSSLYATSIHAAEPLRQLTTCPKCREYLSNNQKRLRAEQKSAGLPSTAAQLQPSSSSAAAAQQPVLISQAALMQLLSIAAIALSQTKLSVPIATHSASHVQQPEPPVHSQPAAAAACAATTSAALLRLPFSQRPHLSPSHLYQILVPTVPSVTLSSVPALHSHIAAPAASTSVCVAPHITSPHLNILVLLRLT